jgi:hypothetical protein
VSFDIELDSIDIDECDAPNKTAQPQKDRVLLRFYGAHACRDTTEVGWLHDNVFFFNCRKNAGNVITFSKKCSSQWINVQSENFTESTSTINNLQYACISIQRNLITNVQSKKAGLELNNFQIL